jgi:acyl-CoA thioesterase-1
LADDRAPLVLAFGDSLTAGYGLARDEAFPVRLEALLRETAPGAVVQNAGVSGDTSGKALARLPRLLSSLDRRPALAIVELGANDLIRRIPPAQTRANLDAILTEFTRCGIATLLATFEPPPFLGSLVGEYAGIYGSVAARHGVAAHPFFPPGVLGHHAHVLRDRLHPNALAIDKVARAMAPVVQRLLADAN